MQCLCDNTTTIHCATVQDPCVTFSQCTQYHLLTVCLRCFMCIQYVKIKCILTVGGPGAAVGVIVSSGMYLSQLLNVTLSPRFWARKEK